MERYCKAFGAEVMVYDPYVTNIDCNSIEEIFTKADVISLHVHVTDETKYSGVVYKYGDVSFGKEEDANGHLPLRFKYDIVDNNGLPRERFTEEFFELIGDILVDIMERQVRKNDKSDN